MLEKQSVTCEKCGRLFPEVRKRFHCFHCKRYFHVCPDCKEKGAKCPLCGIPMKKKSEPVAVR